MSGNRELKHLTIYTLSDLNLAQYALNEIKYSKKLVYAILNF